MKDKIDHFQEIPLAVSHLMPLQIRLWHRPRKKT